MFGRMCIALFLLLWTTWLLRGFPEARATSKGARHSVVHGVLFHTQSLKNLLANPKGGTRYGNIVANLSDYSKDLLKRIPSDGRTNLVMVQRSRGANGAVKMDGTYHAVVSPVPLGVYSPERFAELFRSDIVLSYCISAKEALNILARQFVLQEPTHSLKLIARPRSIGAKKGSDQGVSVDEFLPVPVTK